MTESTELMTVDNICNRVYIIRGQQVMLDYDLAEIYGYEVKNHNQQFVTQSEMRLVTAKVSEISVQVAGAVDWKIFDNGGSK